ncbi:MAG: peptidoglycan bridge formation glycyltransferase FemA/FemB family protein [Candidatus Gracilibacteria bacterium]|nr:peptidoglycan bridge formation glycyltransferase FemA/FemB family protein [Candidatus Gracilibacteria bacterium]
MKIINSCLDENPGFKDKIRNDIGKIFSDISYEPIWQTIEWNEMLKKSGYIDKGFFIGIYDDENLENFVIIEKRSIGLGSYAFFVIGGPINEKYLDLLETEMIRLSKDEKAVYIQIEPLVECKLKRFKAMNLKRFIEPYTINLDLRKTEEELLSAMKPKGRYNIKVAEKNSVSVEKSENTEKNLKLFYDLLSLTTKRDSFNINSLSYFKTFLDYIYENDIGGLYFAKKDEEIVAAGIFIMLKNTCYYYYGASTSDNNKRKYMASYLIQWKVIQEAKSKGCVFYDFLGVAGPESKRSSLIGVTDFKGKFSEKTTKWPDSQIFINKKIMFGLFFLKYKLREFMKNL